jgi:hypothetical protein
MATSTKKTKAKPKASSKTPKKTSTKSKKALRFSQDVMFREVQPGILNIINLKEIGVFYKVYGLAAKVWRKIDGKHDQSDIIETLAAEIKPTSLPIFRKDVSGHLKKFLKLKIVQEINKASR